jgi:CBS domain containing-hemolysin-like protein
MKMKISFFLLLFLFFSLSVQAQFEASKRKVNISAKPDKAPKKKAVVPQNNNAFYKV